MRSSFGCVGATFPSDTSVPAVEKLWGDSLTKLWKAADIHKNAAGKHVFTKRSENARRGYGSESGHRSAATVYTPLLGRGFSMSSGCEEENIPRVVTIYGSSYGIDGPGLTLIETCLCDSDSDAAAGGKRTATGCDGGPHSRRCKPYHKTTLL